MSQITLHISDFEYDTYKLKKYSDRINKRNVQYLIVNDNMERFYLYNKCFHRINGPAIEDKNFEIWARNSLIHRDDGPAIIHKHYVAWYQNGKLHRDNGPAEICVTGLEVYYKHGKLHRVGGPAVKFGEKEEYYQNGKRHRLIGPAVISKCIKEWWINGKRHRINGPAYIFDGQITNNFKFPHRIKVGNIGNVKHQTYFYFIQDKEYSMEDYYNELKKNKENEEKKE
jgi:hypothetical protein